MEPKQRERTFLAQASWCVVFQCPLQLNRLLSVRDFNLDDDYALIHNQWHCTILHNAVVCFCSCERLELIKSYLTLYLATYNTKYFTLQMSVYKIQLAFEFNLYKKVNK